METYLSALAALFAAVGAVAGLGAWWTAQRARTGPGRELGAAELERIRLLAEQSLAAQRSEGEMTRGAVAQAERGLAASLDRGRLATEHRLGELTTMLAREQGESRAALETRLRELAESNGTKLDQVRMATEQRLGELTTTLAREQGESRALLEAKLLEMMNANALRLGEIQRSVNEQLHQAVEKQMQTSFQRVIDQFAAVQKAMGDVQAVTAQIGDLKRIFSNVKSRGGWGETQLRALLDDLLPDGGYLTNVRLREGSNEVVEFAVRMPMRGGHSPLLAVDAKFPVSDYERLLAAAEAGDGDGEKAARRALEQCFRTEARKISDKYIVPPATVEFAVMYLPTDGLYAEAARSPGLIDELGRGCRVLVMGPSLLPALLRTVQLGYVTLALEQKSELIAQLLGATRQEMMKMDAVLEKLAKNAGSMSRTIEEAQRRTRVVGRKLRQVEDVSPEQADALLALTPAEEEESEPV